MFSSFSRHFSFLLCCLVLSLQGIFSGELYDPISVYLTWTHSPETTMSIQWLTLQDRSEDLIEYRQTNENTWRKIEGTHSPLPQRQPYFLHRVELRGLRPNTDYSFRTGKDSVIFKFRTMPTNLSQPIHFVVGGDMYHDELSLVEKTSRQAAKTDPSFVLIGGDIAYSNKKSIFQNENFQRWLDWLIVWKACMVTSDGRLIPIVPAIGNHETLGNYGKTPLQARFFYTFFPMPGKRGYNVLDFGNYMSLFILDSGHTHSIKGAQSQWLYSSMQQRTQRPHKFALYHVPAFPSVFQVFPETSVQIRKTWVPIFEEFGLHVAFENHCHAYKRSHPIMAEQVDPKGVVYMGDGAWGVKEARIPKTPQEAWYLAKSASTRHFILVTIDSSKRNFKAIDQEGCIFDEYTQEKEPRCSAVEFNRL